MLDLRKLSGLDLQVGDDGRLVFGPDVVVSDHGERPLGALAGLMEASAVAQDSRDIAYYMDNGVYRRQDADRLAQVPMRYELTLIPPRKVGREFIKTHGHRHFPEPKSGLEHPEICEVLVGTAHFLFQTLDLAGPSAGAAFLIEAKPGQKVIFPPGFDHVTINPGPEPVLFSDVVALGVKGIYERYVATHGAVYLEVEEAGRPVFVPNPTYCHVPPLRRIAAAEYPALRLTDDLPLYTAFVEGRGAGWEFLNEPGRFWAEFPDLASAFLAS
jgi:glucose-6-phosphate isomerase, archaeal